MSRTGIDFTIALSAKDMAVLDAKLNPVQLSKVFPPAVARTGRKGRTQFDRRIRSELNIDRKYTVGESSRGAAIAFRVNNGGMSGTLTVRGEPLPLIAYHPRKTASGVVFRVRKKGEKTLLRHAFLATVRSGGGSHAGVFSREKHLPTKGPNKGKGKLTAKGYAGRLAIGEHFGPAITTVMGADRLTVIGKEELSKLGDTFRREVAGQVSRQLGIGASDARALFDIPEAE